MVKAQASHQSDLQWVRVQALWLLVLISVLLGFYPGSPVFPSPQLPTFQLTIRCKSAFSLLLRRGWEHFEGHKFIISGNCKFTFCKQRYFGYCLLENGSWQNIYSLISSLLLRLKFFNVVKIAYPYVTFSGKEPLRNPRCISDSTGSVQERHQNYPFHCHLTHDKSGFMRWHKVDSRNNTWPTEGNQQPWNKIVYVVGLQTFLSV